MKAKSKYSIATMMVAAGFLMSCGGNSQQQMPTANFETTIVKKKDVTMENKYSATIRGRQDIDVMPQISGVLRELCVSEGQKVKKGQTLFVIDAVPYREALNAAQAAVKTAQSNLSAAQAAEATAQLNLDSKMQLRAQNIVSDFDVKTAQNALNQAKAQVGQCKAAIAQCQAQVASARNNLSYCYVGAPSDGVVGTLPYRVGALVSPQMQKPLTTVSDNSQMYVYFSINETELLELARLHNGDIDSAISAMPAVKLKLVDGSIYDVEGKVESVSGVVDSRTGSVQLRAMFDNPGKLLHSGSTGSVIMPIEYKNQIVVPATATVQTQDKYKVYVVDNKNIAHENLITLNPQTDGKEYVVTGGLKEGVKIVAKGAGMVHDGQNVKPNPEKKEEKK